MRFAPFFILFPKSFVNGHLKAYRLLFKHLRGVLNAILSFKTSRSFHAGLSGNGTVCTKRAIIKQSTLISGGSGIVLRNDVNGFGGQI